jgi:hypothetical protein
MQKQYGSGKRAGIEINNGERIATEVPKFCSRLLGASGIAGCIISIIQFLSLGDDDFLKRKNIWTLNQVSCCSINTIPYY